MATQPTAPRQWFRLPSVVRGPPLPAAPNPEPPAPQPQPPTVRAPFRPMGMPQPQPQPQPTQPQESTLAPLPAYGVSSVPTSPVRRTSMPSSPVPRTSPPITELSATSSPPKPQVPAPSSSLPTSPSLKPLASPPKPPASPMPPSPPKPAPPSFSAPTSPPKPAPSRFLPPTSPPKLGPTTFSVPTSPPKLEPTTFSVPNSPPKPVPSRFLAPTSPPKPGPTTFSVPISPPKLASTTFSVPNSPPKPETTVTTTPTRVPSPTPSPRTIKPADKTPPQSPYNKPTAPPPSPLILPPPQLIPTETQQKTVLVQTTSEKTKSWLNGTGNHKDFEETHKRSSHAHHGIVNHEVHKDVAKKEKGHLKKYSSDSDHEMGKRVITIAGENKGAIMEVIKSPMKHSFDGNSHNLHKTESDGTGWKSFSSSSDEGKSKKDKNHKVKAMLSPTMGAFMNSNVQGVNNSIVFHSSCSHHDPGVHLSLSRKPSGNGIQIKDKSHGGHHS